MRVLLDECLPRRLKQAFQGHEVATVPEMGWAGAKDRELLRWAAGRFDVLVTLDQGLPFQQNVANLEIGVLLLAAESNRLAELLPLMPEALAALGSLRPGQVTRVSARA